MGHLESRYPASPSPGICHPSSPATIIISYSGLDTLFHSRQHEPVQTITNSDPINTFAGTTNGRYCQTKPDVRSILLMWNGFGFAAYLCLRFRSLCSRTQ